MATAHLGHFLFTALILPKILASKTASYTPRVVYVASGAHAWCDGINLDEMERPDASTYKPMAAYAQAKSANILTAIELSRRAAGRIYAYSLSPGGVCYLCLNQRGLS
jgi:NAD(P)-dependent dehydrogenase (short-subunit alcohol dehydrogenase family)